MSKNRRTKLAAVALASALAFAPMTVRADSTTASIVFGTLSAAMVSGTHLAWGADPKGLGHLPFLPAYSVYGAVYAVSASVAGTIIVFETVVDGSKKFAEILIKDAKTVSLEVGQSIEAVFTGTGHVLQSDGRVLAFLPDDTGTTLLHHEKLN